MDKGLKVGVNVTLNREFQSFKDFYPFYLKEHSNRINRRLHIIGTTISLLYILILIVTGNFSWLLTGLLPGYTLAWIGHFCFEKNKPATFRHPLWSFRGDLTMWAETMSGKRLF
mmetsp:Transcript_7669/g.8641  ORF Transcript_7669/g.8641 Transcript_7669/m.8641 type:complete len:114 (-) Transcript_7669:9-350(-)